MSLRSGKLGLHSETFFVSKTQSERCHDAHLSPGHFSVKRMEMVKVSLSYIVSIEFEASPGSRRFCPKQCKDSIENKTAEISWQVKAMAVQPDNLSAIPRNHEERRELIPASCPLSSPYVQWPTPVLTHRENNKIKQTKTQKRRLLG